MAPLPWPAAASLLAAAGTVLLIRYLWQYRGKPGADWFLASLSFQTTWSVAYGVGLLTFAEPVRWALEVLSWTGMAGTGVYFLAFAFAYTGRGHIVERSRQVFLAFPVVIGLIGATNPVHQLVWVDFTLVPVAGMAGATYDMRLWAVVAATAGVSTISIGSVLLFDTVVSYGPLYRREAIAVGLSTIPPVVAVLLWLYGLGPVPEVNFATVMFLPHVALDAYAFAGSDMFEFHPATRRAGERAAIDDLGAPVVIVDEQERVVTLNTAAEEAFDVRKEGALTRPLAAVLGEGSVDPAAEEDTLRLQRGGRRQIFGVTSTPLSDADATHVGYTVVFQDVTAERRREQRLDVLNRVLRHNLRNDMTVVQGFTEAAAGRIDDPETRSMLDRATSKTTELVALGEFVERVERVLDSDPRSERVSSPTCSRRSATDTSASTRRRRSPSTRPTSKSSPTRRSCRWSSVRCWRTRWNTPATHRRSRSRPSAATVSWRSSSPTTGRDCPTTSGTCSPRVRSPRSSTGPDWVSGWPTGARRRSAGTSPSKRATGRERR